MIHSRAFKHHGFTDKLLCTVAAAVLGAGALGAGASIWGSSNAANAQTNAANASIANQRSMYESNKNLLSPFITAGQNQLGTQQSWLNPNDTSSPLNALMKLLMPGANQNEALMQTPGYQFNMSQGLRAANNALSARGLGGSGGAVAKGAANFASGLASNTWSGEVGNLLNLFTTGAGAGQNFINSGINAGSALSGAGANSANQISSALTGAGNAQAANYNAIGSAVGGLGNSLTTASLLQQLGGNSNGGGGGLYGSVGVGGGYQMPTVGYNAYG